MSAYHDTNMTYDSDCRECGRLEKEIDKKDAENERLRKALREARALANFGLACIEEHKAWNADIDGGWLQDKALELGVLARVEVTEPCCEDGCRCAEWDDFPQECYRYSDLTESYRAAHEEKP